MSLPDRNNPYSFEAFLNLLHGFDFYADDPFLQKTLKYFAEMSLLSWIASFGSAHPRSPSVSGP